MHCGSHAKFGSQAGASRFLTGLVTCFATQNVEQVTTATCGLHRAGHHGSSGDRVLASASAPDSAEIGAQVAGSPGVAARSGRPSTCDGRSERHYLTTTPNHELTPERGRSERHLRDCQAPSAGCHAPLRTVVPWPRGSRRRQVPAIASVAHRHFRGVRWSDSPARNVAHPAGSSDRLTCRSLGQ